MEAIIRQFNSHFTGMILDCDNQIRVCDRSFATEVEAREWLAKRGFGNVDMYDWRIVERTNSPEEML